MRRSIDMSPAARSSSSRQDGSARRPPYAVANLAAGDEGRERTRKSSMSSSSWRWTGVGAEEDEVVDVEWEEE